jgi:hypothetical protein
MLLYRLQEVYQGNIQPSAVFKPAERIAQGCKAEDVVQDAGR